MTEGRKLVEGCCDQGGQGWDYRRWRRVSLCQSQSSRPIALYPSIWIGWVSRWTVMRGRVLARRDCKRIIRLVLACTANPESQQTRCPASSVLGTDKWSARRGLVERAETGTRETDVRRCRESRTKPWGVWFRFREMMGRVGASPKAAQGWWWVVVWVVRACVALAQHAQLWSCRAPASVA